MRPLIPDTPAGSALAKAFVVQHQASLKGFDWEDPRDALAKVREEAEEVGALLADGGAAVGDPSSGGYPGARDHRLQEEIGDLLFAVVNVARLAGVDPRPALDRATAKFEERFAEVERLARLRDLPMPGTPLADLDRLWDEIKAGDWR
ncbi:MAG: hypothetical protein F4205_03555 [Gemmatimonadetes bacterium]|nr:hypothetical protein [Gemmatimonadota bacterium]MXX71832.1 hypothetical protein [Gemmatimonadota bacterium]MYC93027.1 hypothetical protein [Gemmatimonadota bacterium]MYG34550.1 hypothetical protein [Gemmatimonadota bacterium]